MTLTNKHSDCLECKLEKIRELSDNIKLEFCGRCDVVLCEKHYQPHTKTKICPECEEKLCIDKFLPQDPKTKFNFKICFSCNVRLNLKQQLNDIYDLCVSNQNTKKGLVYEEQLKNALHNTFHIMKKLGYVSK